MPTAGGIRAGKAFVFVEAVDKTQAVMRRIEADFTRRAQRLNAIGRRLITRSLLALAPAALSTKTFADFDDSMRKVEARSSGTAQQMANLRKQAKDLGRTTSFTARQVGELQAKLAQKGFDRAQLADITPNVLNLARAAGEGGEEDTVVAADLLSGTLRAFQLGAEQAARVADIFTTAVNNSNFSLEGLMDSMAKSGALAADYNMSVEETVATLASMTNLNIAASEAGTALNSFLARMSKSEFTDAFNEGLASMGKGMVSFRDNAGNLRKPIEILDEIARVTKDLGTAERGELFSRLFGVLQFGKATGGARGAVEALELLNKLQTESQGQAEKTAKEMDAGLGGSFRKFMSAVEGVAIAIGESLAPTLSTIVERINVVIEGAARWIEQNKEIVLLATTGAAAVIGLGTAIISLGLGLKLAAFTAGTLAALLGILKTVFAVLVSPIGLVVASIALVTAILYKFSTAFRNIASSVVDFVGNKFRELAGILGETFEGILAALSVGDFQAVWEIVVSGMGTAWLSFVNTLKTAWEAFTSFFTQAFFGAIGAVQTAWLKGQQMIANSILDLASQDGILGDALDLILGVDVSAEKKRGIDLERQRIEGNIRRGIDSRSNDDGFTQGKKALNDEYNARIDSVQKRTGDIVNEQDQAIAEERKARQAEIEARRKALRERVDEVKRRAEEQVDEESRAFTGIDISQLSGAAMALQGPAILSGQSLQGLEKGSLEAAQAFEKNRQESMAQKQFEEQKKSREALERIERKIGNDTNDVNTV